MTTQTQTVEQLRPSRKRYVFPKLHERQMEVAFHPAQFKVVVCGRQWGKTWLGAFLAVRAALEGKHIWWVAPSFPIGDLGWRRVLKLSAAETERHVEGRPVYRITFPTGGTIQLRSADNPDSLRGATLDGLVFDEAAQAKEDAWPTLEPTLLVRDGWALFISTPRGMNWFYDLYEEATDLPGWERWQIPSITSPYMTPEKLERARKRHSALYFSQEYEAEFISAGSGMFKADWFRHWHWDKAREVYVLGDEQFVSPDECLKFATVDLASSKSERADYTVISTWAVTPKKHLILLDVTRDRMEGPDIVPALRLAYERHHPGFIAMERTGRQTGIIQEAVRTGLPIREVSAKTVDQGSGLDPKVRRALPATARMEQGTVWFPRDQWMRELEGELLAFPVGKHDDFVDTLSYACYEITQRSVYEDHGLEVVG
jgi:predicted phage terminase large subunit-like protein